VSLGRDPLTGAYRQTSRVFEGGKREAQKALAELVTQVAHGNFTAGGSDATVAELLAQWLDLVRDRLSPTTRLDVPDQPSVVRLVVARPVCSGAGRADVHAPGPPVGRHAGSIPVARSGVCAGQSAREPPGSASRNPPCH